MAITFYTAPTDYSPSDNPLLYVWGSDETGQPNFSFRVTTFLGAAVVSQDTVYVETSNRAHIDVSPVISKVMNLPRVTSTLSTDMDIIELVSIRVDEYYGSPAILQDSATSVQSNVFKASLSPREWEDTNFLTTYVDQKWLTDTPNNTFRVIRGQDVLCSMLCSVAATFRIRFYNISGVLLDTYISASSLNKYRQLNVGSVNLASIYTGLDYNDVAAFDVKIGTSETLVFIYVDDYCFDIHSLVWLNKYGTFDTYPIEHNVTNKTDIESRSYKRVYGEWIGLRYSYDANSSGNIDIEKTMTDKGELVTNYMTDTMQNWFVSAYESPQCYLYNVNGLLFRATITNTSHRTKQGRFDDLIMEEMSYEKSMPRKSVAL